jgi:tetratricopeptide (TPR) repeat protein
VLTFPDAIRAFAERPYGMGEKVLTEAAALWCYLFDLIVPRPGAFGLYHDDFPLAQGLLDPWYTLPALLGIIALLAGGFMARARAPVVAFAVLWFLAGHLLESTHINLEIYFEHRNYVPSISMAFLLAWAAIVLADRMGTRLAAAAAGAYLALLALVTLQNNVLWSNPLAEAYEAVRNHPRSFAANALLGNRLLGAGRVDEARAQFTEMADRFPDLMYPPLKLVGLYGCVLDEPLEESFWEEAIPFAARARAIRYEVAAEMDALIGAIAVGDCDAVDARRLLVLVETLADNPRFVESRAMLLELAANLALYLEEWERALAHMVRATRLDPKVERRLRLVTIERNLGLAEEARAELARLEADLAWHPVLRAGFAERINELRRSLSAAGTGSR